MIEDLICFRYPHTFKILQTATAFLVIACLGTTPTVDGGGVLWMIVLGSLIVSVMSTVLFIMDKSDVILTISNGAISWNMFEFAYSSILALLNLLAAWLSFAYAGNVPPGYSGTGYVLAGLFLIANMTFYTAPSLMLYQKVRETELGNQCINAHYANDQNLPYQTPPRVV
uniref:MARVEL domain-containing protein n=1 Tax=Panagrellus redivivus TaxID=6233 RepID=A0A7E4WDK8_PANRE